MKHRAVFGVLGVAGTLAIVVSLAVAGAGSARTTGPSAAAAVKPPPVPGAQAIKAKYGGQSITVLLDAAVGNSHVRDQNLVEQFSKQTGINVKLVPSPADSSANYALVARTFSSHSSSIDVTRLDVIWPGAFANYLVDLKPALGQQAKLHAAGIVLNDTVKGRLVAMPWFGDFGILYYRTDLLKKYGYSKPPVTWAELGAMATKIQEGERGANPNFYGFVYQGNAYEGLTCDSLEWIASSGGGQFIDGGKVTINNPKAAAILNLQRSWVGNIVPRDVTTYQEEDARNAFDAGNAMFMRNWPYAYSASKGTPVDGKFAVAVLPHSGKNPSVGTVGGWQLGVSKYSKHIGASIEFVRWMTGAGVQRYDAIFNSNVPTMPSVAALPAVRKTNPYLIPSIAKVTRVTRPARYLGPNYAKGSQVIYQGVNQILNGKSAQSVLPSIAQQLNTLIK